MVSICTVCPSGETVIIDFSNRDEVTVDVMGPSEDQVDPNDALSGSNEKLMLTSGDAFIVKEICPFDTALILSISFSVKDVASVKIVFLDSLSNPITTATVSLIF